MTIYLIIYGFTVVVVILGAGTTVSIKAFGARHSAPTFPSVDAVICRI